MAGSVRAAGFRSFPAARRAERRMRPREWTRRRAAAGFCGSRRRLPPGPVSARRSGCDSRGGIGEIRATRGDRTGPDGRRDARAHDARRGVSSLQPLGVSMAPEMSAGGRRRINAREDRRSQKRRPPQNRKAVQDVADHRAAERIRRPFRRRSRSAARRADPQARRRAETVSGRAGGADLLVGAGLGRPVGTSDVAPSDHLAFSRDVAYICVS